MGVLVVLIVVTLVVATVGSRLLGVRVPLRRALVTGLAGVAAGVFAGYLRAGTTRTSTAPRWWALRWSPPSFQRCCSWCWRSCSPGQHGEMQAAGQLTRCELFDGPHVAFVATRSSRGLWHDTGSGGSLAVRGPTPCNWGGASSERSRRPVLSSSSSPRCSPPEATSCPKVVLEVLNPRRRG